MNDPLAIGSRLMEDVAPRRPAVHDLRIVLVLVTAHLVLSSVGEYVPAAQLLQVPLGLALVLFVPGYCLTAALFPRADHLSAVERVGLSIALSIASIAVLTLVLDASPWGLQPAVLVLGEYVVVAALASLGLVRRAQLPADDALGSVKLPSRTWWRRLPPPDRRATGAIAIAQAVLLVAAGVIFLSPPLDRSLTEFYTVGPDGQIGGYPYAARDDGTVALTLGITNRETESIRYRIEAWAADEPREAPQLVLATSSVVVHPGESWEVAATWRMPYGGPARTVDVYLIRADDPEGAMRPYRSLTLSIDVPDAPAG